MEEKASNQPITPCKVCGKNDDKPMCRFIGVNGAPDDFIHPFCGTLAAADPYNKPEWELLHVKGVRHKYRNMDASTVGAALTQTRSAINPSNNNVMYIVRDLEKVLADLERSDEVQAALQQTALQQAALQQAVMQQTVAAAGSQTPQHQLMKKEANVAGQQPQEVPKSQEAHELNLLKLQEQVQLQQQALQNQMHQQMLSTVVRNVELANPSFPKPKGGTQAPATTGATATVPIRTEDGGAHNNHEDNMMDEDEDDDDEDDGEHEQQHNQVNGTNTSHSLGEKPAVFKRGRGRPRKFEPPQPASTQPGTILPPNALPPNTTAQQNSQQQHQISQNSTLFSKQFPPRHFPPPPPGKIRCQCGGTHQPTGTRKGNKSWYRHAKTKEHLRWLQMVNAEKGITTPSTPANNNASQAAAAAASTAATVATTSVQAQYPQATQVYTPVPTASISTDAKPSIGISIQQAEIILTQLTKLSQSSLIPQEKKIKLIGLLCQQFETVYSNIPIAIVKTLDQANDILDQIPKIFQNEALLQTQKRHLSLVVFQQLETYYKNFKLTPSADMEHSLAQADVMLNQLQKLSKDDLGLEEEEKRVLANLLTTHLESAYGGVSGGAATTANVPNSLPVAGVGVVANAGITTNPGVVANAGGTTVTTVPTAPSTSVGTTEMNTTPV